MLLVIFQVVVKNNKADMITSTEPVISIRLFLTSLSVYLGFVWATGFTMLLTYSFGCSVL